MLDPAVSVIIPAFGSGRFIETAIASVVAQSMGSWECIVVDDGSTDDTLERARASAALDPRIRCLTQERRGPSAARNAGLRAARGEFVQYLDADDRIAPTKMERQTALLAADDSLDLVYGDAAYFDDARPDLLRRTLGPSDAGGPEGISGRGDRLVAALLRGNVMVVEAPLVRRRLLESVGGFDESLELAEDWDLWLRCALTGAAFRFDPGDAGRSFVRVHVGSASADRAAMLRAGLAMRHRWVGRLGTAALENANRVGMHGADGALVILEAPRGRLVDEIRRLALAAVATRRARWFLWLLALPLLHVRPGRDLAQVIRRSRGRP